MKVKINMDPIIVSFTVLVALTIGLVQVIKKVGGDKVGKNITPFIALVVGVGLTVLGNVSDLTSLTVLNGIAVGLSSVGLFSQKLLFSTKK